MWKRILISLGIIVLALSVWWGVRQGHFEETKNYGSIMCLSCMGIE